jgi:hypothetical protein
MKRCFTLLVVALVSLWLAEAVQAERVEWKKDDGGNGHSYDVIAVADGISWTGAQDAAIEQGGHLATIGSKEENAFVFKVVDDEKFWRNDGYNNYGPWLGGFQEKEAEKPIDGWSWVNKEEWSYDNWNDGEPNDSDGTEDRQEDYLHFFALGSLDRQAQWNDSPGESGNLMAYVIEWTPEGEEASAATQSGDENDSDSDSGEDESQ